MAIRGEIVVECDNVFCHAELVISAERLSRSNDLFYEIEDSEWLVARRQEYLCPKCAELKAELEAG